MITIAFTKLYSLPGDWTKMPDTLKETLNADAGYDLHWHDDDWKGETLYVTVTTELLTSEEYHRRTENEPVDTDASLLATWRPGEMP